MRLLGAILIALGIAALVWGGFSYTHRDKLVDVGPIQASVDHEKHVGIPPIAGVCAVIAGIVLFVIPRRTRGA